MVGKDTQIKQKKTSAGYTDPCPMQETVGIPEPSAYYGPGDGC